MRSQSTLAVRDIPAYVGADVHAAKKGPDLERFLAAVDARCDQAFLLASSPDTAGAAERSPLPGRYVEIVGDVRRFLLAGGKRVRPRLCHIFGTLVDAPAEQLASAAVAAELIHAGSLLHDDVLDQATLRRGKPSLRVVHGDQANVLLGDMLITEAIHQVEPLGGRVVADAVSAVTAMARGALLENIGRGQIDQEDRWRSVVAGKTGALFAFCGHAAGALGSSTVLKDAGLDAAAARRGLGECGLRLGIAFQLVDDLLDLYAEDSGKDRFADLRNGECTFPLLVAAREDESFAQRLAALWRQEVADEAEVQALGAALLATHAAEATLQRIAREGRAALAALGPLIARPAADELARWADLLVDRARGLLAGPSRQHGRQYERKHESETT